jgi:hypothetical protein
MAEHGVRTDTDTDINIDIEELWQEFHRGVNMTSRELREYLNSLPEDPPGPGPRVLDILGKRRTDLTADDVAVMAEVVEVLRREAPDPYDEPVAGDDAWRQGLMAVGHDPLKPR